MSALLLTAAGIMFLTGVAHSYLGEKYILIRLFRHENLPRLSGSDWFTKRTLRFAWHLTSVAWWGLALVLLEVARAGEEGLPAAVARVIVATCVVSAAVSFGFTRGRHLSWVAFLAVALLTWLAV